MEGPTPVSALIHAATMVTAGVYMIARTHVLFDRSPFALGVVAIVGAATALFAATIGLVQNDIKRVLAYSTISQLGYMFLGLRRRGLLGRHLPSRHARLLQGAALPRRRLRHSRHGRRAGPAQDGRPAQETSRHLLDHDRGRLRHRRLLPLRRLLLERRHPLRRISPGNRRQNSLVRRPRHGAAHLALHVPPLVHDLPRRAAQPRTPILTRAPGPCSSRSSFSALLSVCGGWIGIERFGAFLAPAAGALHLADQQFRTSNSILSIAAVLVALEGWLIADKYYRRKPERPAQLAAALPAGYKLLANKYYVDEIYGAVIVKPLLAVSKYVLGWVVDTAILGGIAWLLAGIANFTGTILQRWQSGNLRSYAAWLAAGAAAVLLFVLWLPWILSGQLHRTFDQSDMGGALR